MSSHLDFSTVCVALFVVLCVAFCRSLFVLLDFNIVLSALLRLTASGYPFSIFWLPWLPLWYLLVTLVTPLVSSGYPFGIFWLPLWYLLVTLVTPLVSSGYPFSIFWLPWLPLLYLHTFLKPKSSTNVPKKVRGNNLLSIVFVHGGRRGHDRMVVGFTITCAIIAYHHYVVSCESNSSEVYSMQHYVIKFVGDLRQVGGFRRVLRFLHQ